MNAPTGPAGPAGAVGPTGPTGPIGATGPAGAAGATPTVEVAATNTGAPGSLASVTAANTATGVALTFTVPQGPTGPAGTEGAEGPIGATPTVEVAATNTGDPGTQAEVSAANTATGVALTFTIPQGPTGPTGPTGATPTVEVAATNTGEPGTEAEVSAANTDTGVALTFTIPRGAPGGNITENNAILTYPDSQDVTAGNTVTFSTRTINPDSGGSITRDGTTSGVTLAAGQYLVTYVSDVGVTGAGSITAALQLDSTPLAYADTALAQTGAATERITLNAIVTSTGGQTLNVTNNGSDQNSHENSVLTVVQLS